MKKFTNITENKILNSFNNITNKTYQQHFLQTINKIKEEGRYRKFTPLTYSTDEHSPIAVDSSTGKKLTIWCSNDYLGMSRHPAVIEHHQQAAAKYGVGAGGTRNISGSSTAISTLERDLALLHNKQDALVFTSGYVANQASIAALGTILPDAIVFSDQYNHSSIINGIKMSGMKKHIFPHNNLNVLSEQLEKYPHEKPKIIICESLYSMTGSVAPLPQIITLAQKNNAIIYLDEVHAVGLYGEKGSGIAEHFGIADQIDIIQGTLAKAFGLIGGYISSSSECIKGIMSIAPSFIFTTALPPTIASTASFCIKMLSGPEGKILRKKQQDIVYFTKDLLKKKGIFFMKNSHHIIPVMIGDAQKAEIIATKLKQEYGIYVQHINYPTVPRGSERLRITPGPLHSKEMAEELCWALQEVLGAEELLNK